MSCKDEREGFHSDRGASEGSPSANGRPLLHKRGMATALSIDQWQANNESQCSYETDSDLSVNFICMHPSPADQRDSKTPTFTPPPDKTEAARWQEIFMDLVGMHCAWLDAGCRHVLDDRFDSFLGEGERDFKDSILEFLQNQTPAAASTRAHQYLEGVLRSKMGYQANLLCTCTKSGKKYLYRRQDMGNDTSTTSSTAIPTKVPREAIKIDPSPGHVFVCLSSVCEIQCDAFLMPCQISVKSSSLNGSIVAQWRKETIRNNPILSQTFPERRRQFKLKRHPDCNRVVTLRDWPWEKLQASAICSPVPFVVAGEVSTGKICEYTGMEKTSDSQHLLLPPEELHIEALLETVRQFLKVAVTELERNQPRPHVFRERYLLALPVLGTGFGRAGDLTGHIVERLLQLLSQHAVVEREPSKKVDVVLVCADEATYAHAQTIRYQVFESHNVGDGLTYSPPDIHFPCFEQLGLDMRDDAEHLASLASQRQLALFLGAGVSIGSGLPSWFGLLHYIEDFFTETGDPAERKLGEDTDWNPLIMADRLEEICSARPDRSGNKLSLKQRACDHLRADGQRPGLLLTLLMSLPCHSMVTQNYDTLIERACKMWNLRGERDDFYSTKRNLSVIPYRPRRKAQYWLLKMHGCVSAPEEIVLTSTDYAQYESSRYQALGGLVQASLMTKHLLFVGFSLTDPNYLRIVNQVRNALLPYSDKQVPIPAHVSQADEETND